MLTRRTMLTGLAGAGALAVQPLGARRAFADQRVLSVNIPGNSLGVHIPYMAALYEILPTMGYGVPDVERVSKLQTITQSILTGSVEIGAGDAISALRAVEAGADLRIIGNAFMHTSLVFVVNADKVPSLQDVTNDDVTLAVNSTGDFTHVMVLGPLLKEGIDVNDVNFVTMGGSGTRMRALLAGKVDGVPIHFDQATEVAKQGNFKTLIEPAKVYDAFLGEVWITSAEWLEKPENRKAAKDLLVATITAFRRANEEFNWYAEMYRKYGTDESMPNATDDEIRVTWQALGQDIGTWPADMRHQMSVYEELLPVYKEAGAIQGTVDLSEVVVTGLVDEALAELP